MEPRGIASARLFFWAIRDRGRGRDRGV